MRAAAILRAVQIVLALAVVAAAALTLSARRSGARAREAASEHRPVAARADGYVSSQQCRACHPEQYESWHRSYHRTMTQVASPETVLADFDDLEPEIDGERHSLSHEADAFWFETAAPDGVGTVRRKISLITGSHHMQVYWFEIDSSRWLGQVPFSYLTEDRRWIPRRAAFLRPPDKPRGGDHGRWNSTCVHCHATHGQPRIDGNTADTQVAEFGIACEACHGPGHAHVQANTLPLHRYANYFSAAKDDTIVQPADLSHTKASEICAQCHGLWQMQDGPAMQRALVHGQTYRPGGTRDGQYLFQPSQRDANPQIADIMRDSPEYVAGQFWTDGMARASSREYHGLVDTACYKEGEMSCLSCHTMHKKADDPRPWAEWADDQLGAGMDGNGACTQCHGDIGKAVEKHTFHPAASEGSRCYNCHMPHTSYGLLKAIRSHQVSSPDVAHTVTHGRPNACNLCHLDRSLGWAANALKTQWGIAPPTLDADQAHLPAGVLWALKGDAGQRALVGWHMGWAPAHEASGGGWFAPLLGELLDDPYDAVRIVAGRALPKHRGFEDFAFDPVPRPWTRMPAAPGVVARWQEMRGEHPREPTPAPAFTPSGERDETLFARLLRERDQKAVHLLE